MKSFEGKVAVITGGASGIGLGMARSFAQRGMKLVIADLNEKALADVVTELEAGGTEVTSRLTDVSKHEELQALADLTMERFGAVHVMCNNAGVGLPTSARNMKMADWKWIIDVDLWGPIYGVDVFLPLIEDQGEGHINATSSMSGLIASQMMGAYSVSKHGVVGLMTSLERELRAKKSPVTASVLCPGPINTNISRHSVDYRPGKAKPKADGEKAGKLAASIQAMLEAGMQPNEVGDLVVVENQVLQLGHPRQRA